METVYLLMFRTSQQATEQASGPRSERHAKAQVPTDWTQSRASSLPFGLKVKEEKKNVHQ